MRLGAGDRQPNAMKSHCSHIDLIRFEHLCPAIGNDIEPKAPANGSEQTDALLVNRGKNVHADRGR
jgi:hypothetical protein